MPTKQLRIAVIVTALVAVAGVPPVVADDVAVVVNKSSTADVLSMVQLRKLLLGQETQLGGKKAVIYTTAAGQAERVAALKAATGMTEIDFNLHFMQAQFKGEMLEAPRVMGSAALVRQAVAAAPGGLGLIKVADVDNSVKVVKINGVAAGHPGYLIVVK